MAVYTLNPLTDQRYPAFLKRHADASIFHTPGWLEALRCTYGYEPVVYTTCPPDTELTNGIVMCRVQSWLTGHRFVSVPFSDHCEPLLGAPEDLTELLFALQDTVLSENLKYVELRPLKVVLPANLASTDSYVSSTFYCHVLDISPDIDALFKSLHRSCIRKKIRRADKEGLVYQEGLSDVLLDTFYRLLLMTRRKHQVPPPPITWFRNLARSCEDMMKIRVAKKDGVPIAATVTLLYNNTGFWKYTGLNQEYSAMGPVPFLVWKAIQQAKEDDLRYFDIGRTDVENESLALFKDRWATKRLTISYLRFPVPMLGHRGRARKMKFAKRVFSRLPDRLLVFAGRVLYRHIG